MRRWPRPAYPAKSCLSRPTSVSRITAFTRSDAPPGDPGSPVEERGHGAGTGRAVPAEPAGDLQALEGLGRAGLITRRRDAQRRPGRLEADGLRGATEWLDGYRQFWTESYQRLDTLLADLHPGRPGSRRPGRAAMRTTTDLMIEPRDARDLVSPAPSPHRDSWFSTHGPTRAAAAVVRAPGHVANGSHDAGPDERGQSLEQHVDLGAVARWRRTGQGGDLEGNPFAAHTEVSRHECRVTCFEKCLTTEINVQRGAGSTRKWASRPSTSSGPPWRRERYGLTRVRSHRGRGPSRSG